MKNSRIEVKPSGAQLGAEIHNINLTDTISEVEKETLRQALDQYEVVFFPKQKLTPHHQKEATRIFGPLFPSYTFFDHLDDDPEIEVVINDGPLTHWGWPRVYYKPPASINLLTLG